LSEKQELKGMLDEAEKRGSSLAVEVSRLIIFLYNFLFFIDFILFSHLQEDYCIANKSIK